MPAMSLDLMVEQGTSWSHGFIPLINGSPVMAAGWTARGQVRTDVSATDVLYEWSSTAGNLSIDTSIGSITLALRPSESSAWNWRHAVYDLEVTSPDGSTTYRVVQGSVSISPEVTR